MKNLSVITKNEQETQKLGEQIAKQLSPGDVVCLKGNLGSGKTTFVKGVAKFLGVTSRIISPTYVIVREHTINSRKSRPKADQPMVEKIQKLYHIDLYRLESEKEVLGIDLSIVLKDKKAVTLIEWPEIAESLIPHFDLLVSFDTLSEKERKISVIHN